MEKNFSHSVTLTLIAQWPMSNSSELFSYILQYFQVLNGLNHYFLVIVYTDRQTDTHTDGHEYSIVAVDKPQL